MRLGAVTACTGHRTTGSGFCVLASVKLTTMATHLQACCTACEGVIPRHRSIWHAAQVLNDINALMGVGADANFTSQQLEGLGRAVEHVHYDSGEQALALELLRARFRAPLADLRALVGAFWPRADLSQLFEKARWSRKDQQRKSVKSVKRKGRRKRKGGV